MKSRLATLFAATLAFAVAGTSSPYALAAPLHVPAPTAPASSPLDVTKVQAIRNEFRRGGRHYRGGRHFRGGRHYRGGHRHHGGRYHYRPRAHYRHRHRGGDFIAPLVGGLIIGGMIASQPRGRYYHRYADAHVNWCLNRYRSYDVRTDTFQPYRGPRRKCRSPYG